MIKKVLSISRVTEVDAVSMRIIGAYKNTTLSTDPYLVAMFTALEAQSKLLTAAINRSKAESTLDEADETRDDKVRAFFYLVMGLVHHPNATIKAAAEEVNKVFERYGVSITRESYATESSLIVSLLGDLSKQKLQDAMAQLSGCAEIIAELQSAQDNFETIRIAYEAEKAEEGTQKNATSIKKEVLALLNEKIVVYMRAMEIVTPDTHGAFARTIAEIIADNNEVVKKRRKKDDSVEGEL